MEKIAHLRRQAALCLSLSRFCPDAAMAEHLTSMAALFHEGALRAEFEDEFGPGWGHHTTSPSGGGTRH
jgi:hypothetical protein